MYVFADLQIGQIMIFQDRVVLVYDSVQLFDFGVFLLEQWHCSGAHTVKFVLDGGEVVAWVDLAKVFVGGLEEKLVWLSLLLRR